MLWAQWSMVGLMTFTIVSIIANQGKPKDGVCDGWDAFGWLVLAILLVAAGAFNRIIGIP